VSKDEHTIRNKKKTPSRV